MLLIFCAELEEAKNIKCADAKIIITGIGLCNILKMPILNVKPNDILVNVGYAGSTTFGVGTVMGVNSCKRLTPSKTIQEPTLELQSEIFSCECCTSDDFIKCDVSQIQLVDMELYYLASIYPQIQSIKIVSDNLDYKQYKKADLKESWGKVNKILNELCNK